MVYQEDALEVRAGMARRGTEADLTIFALFIIRTGEENVKAWQICLRSGVVKTLSGVVVDSLAARPTLAGVYMSRNSGSRDTSYMEMRRCGVARDI